jgi:chemotaxis protein methyltransferase CheR
MSCDELLRWALPRLELRWAGYRRVRGQVCKRLGRRMRVLGIGDLEGYRRRLEEDAGEWRVLDGLCRVSVSRFHRDGAIFGALVARVLPELAARGRDLAAWSAGCGAGEEPYTLAMGWRLAVGPRFPGVDLRIVATDADPGAIERARRGCYRSSSVKELPAPWRAAAFRVEGERLCLRDEVRAAVELRCEDLRTAMPEGPFDLVLCRNLAFTYFASPLRERVALALVRRLRMGGALVIGGREDLGGAERALGLSAVSPGLFVRDPPG